MAVNEALRKMSDWDCEAFLDSVIRDIIPRAKDNCKYLPDLTNLPFMEPRLRQVYYEVYLATLLGFPNVSLIMQGILLEALVKEIIFSNERRQFHGTFGAAINHCTEKGYIDEGDEFNYLFEFKDKIRNPYQHIDIEKITDGSSVLGWRIPISYDNVGGSILHGITKIFEGLSGPPERYSVKDLRAVGTIIKKESDEENYLIQFLQAAWFVRMMSRKYFPVD